MMASFSKWKTKNKFLYEYYMLNAQFLICPLLQKETLVIVNIRVLSTRTGLQTELNCTSIRANDWEQTDTESWD